MADTVCLGSGSTNKAQKKYQFGQIREEKKRKEFPPAAVCVCSWLVVNDESLENNLEVKLFQY